MGLTHPLLTWKNRQDPPWTTKYLAGRLGVQHGWLSTILNAGYRKRGGHELAYAVEVLTDGEVPALDMLLTPAEKLEIEKRIMNSSGRQEARNGEN